MKILKKFLLFILITILIILALIGLQGYNLYNSAISQVSLSDKVNEIRNNENFVKYSDLPDDLVNATIAVEDHRFRDHGAIDIVSIGRAIFSNIKAQNLVEGGSTITQQVAKNLYFMENTDDFSRKVAELIMSYHLEKY